MIEELKLINRNDEINDLNETPFNGSSDIDFNENGNFVRCTEEEGLEQNVLKAILTGVQLNGYGTEIYSLLGKKNIEFLRSKLMYEILSTFHTLKNNQLSYLSQFPTYNKTSVIGEIFNIKTEKKDKTSFRVSLKIMSLDSKIKNDEFVNDINFEVG